MFTHRRCWAVIALALVAHHPASTYAAAAEVPVFNLSSDPATLAASYVTVADGRHVRAIRRVAIVSFIVEYIDSREASPTRPQRDERKNSEDRTIAANVAIAPDPAQLKPIADTLYDLAVENWRAAGIEVLAPEALARSSGFADLEPALRQTPYRFATTDETGKRTSLVVSPHDRPAYAAAGREPPTSAERALAKVSDVTVVSARFVIDFLTLRAAGNRVFHKKFTPLYIQTVRAGESGYRLIVPDGGVVAVTLKKPVRAPEAAVTIGAQSDDAERTDEEPDNDKNTPWTERLAINRAVYYDQALRYLGATQDMFLAALLPANPAQR
jgi:hypothetical protein